MKKESDSPSKTRALLLAISFAAGAATLFYAVTITATADTSFRPYAAAAGIALVVILLIGGFIDVKSEQPGILPAILATIPKLYRWSVTSAPATIFACIVTLSLATLSIWLGPFGLRSISIACDDATTVHIEGQPAEQACHSALSTTMWSSPLRRYRAISFTCFDSEKNAWKGRIQDSTSGVCGARPLDSRYVTNGIRELTVDPASVVGHRTVDGIQRLREALSDGRLPDRRLKDRLLLASWNLRHLGAGGPKRLDEAYAYIAEVISHFDIVAVQEVSSRAGLDQVLAYLGDSYHAEFGLFPLGASGSRELIGFVFDARKVGLGDVSTTLVGVGQDLLPGSGQPIRPPFLASFVVNGQPILIVTAHVYFGRGSEGGVERQLAELRFIGSNLRRLASYFPDRPLILAGDLNVYEADGPEMDVLIESGFKTDRKLSGLPSVYGGTGAYDQILVLESSTAPLYFGEVGTFPVFDYVFRDSDWSSYKIDFKRISNRGAAVTDGMYRRLRMNQISDHLPKWAEFRLDSVR